MEIINMTQHAGSADQVAAGLVEPSAEQKKEIVSSISFEEIPSLEEMEERAQKLAEIASVYPAAMIGGAPYFQAPLERALLLRGVKPLYAFSKRESVDEKLPDGSVRKVAVFRHAGWVAPYGLPENV
jgi:hypothetical protein